MKEKSKTLYLLTLLLAITIFILGSWWMYVIYNYDTFLKHREPHKIYQMLFWEGGTFIILLLMISFSFIYLYFKDQKEAKSLNEFFASITHELKTPLASIKLQGEVIQEYLDPHSHDSLKKLLKRLISDTKKLESQLDQLLQLARMERGGELNLETLSFKSFFNKIISDYPDMTFNISINGHDFIVADRFALEIIFKNLIENSIRHGMKSNIDIEIKNSIQKTNSTEIIYFDHGIFDGDLTRLGQLFYKHNSHKGSGVGLYLSKKLMEKMNGALKIESRENGLVFSLRFLSAEDIHA